MQSEVLAKKNNSIHPTALINWEKIQIGNGNIIGPYVCIGLDPLTYSQESDGIIKIGDNNIIREFTTIQLPTKDSKITQVGNNNFLMSNTHISHDCKIENDITLAIGVVLNGQVNVMVGSYIGSGVVAHQYQTIGSYSIVGMNSTITKKSEIKPGGKYIGSPAKYIGINQVGLDRFNVSKEELDNQSLRYRCLIHKY